MWQVTVNSKFKLINPQSGLILNYLYYVNMLLRYILYKILTLNQLSPCINRCVRAEQLNSFPKTISESKIN